MNSTSIIPSTSTPHSFFCMFHCLFFLKGKCLLMLGRSTLKCNDPGHYVFKGVPFFHSSTKREQNFSWKKSNHKVVTLRMSPLPSTTAGLSCTTTFQTDWPSTKAAPVGCSNRQLRHLNLTLLLSQKVGCMAEVVTQSGTSRHLGRVAWLDWWTFCHLASKSAGTLSCNPAHVLWGTTRGHIMTQAHFPH